MNIFKLFKNVKNDTPICFISLDKDKFKENIIGSCKLQINPYFNDKLSDGDWDMLQDYLNSVVDVIKNKIDNIEEL